MHPLKRDSGTVVWFSSKSNQLVIYKPFCLVHITGQVGFFMYPINLSPQNGAYLSKCRCGTDYERIAGFIAGNPPSRQSRNRKTLATRMARFYSDTIILLYCSEDLPLLAPQILLQASMDKTSRITTKTRPTSYTFKLFTVATLSFKDFPELELFLSV